MRAKKVEEKTKPTLEDPSPSVVKLKDTFAPATGIHRNEDGQIEVGEKEFPAPQKQGGLLKPSSNKFSPRSDANEITFPKEDPKDKLEKNRLAAIEKKKEIETKQAALTQQRN